MPIYRDPTLRRNARQLRKQGMPFKRIAAELGLSPSTVHLWTRDIELTPAQIAYNLRGPKGPQNPEHVAKRMAAWAARSR
ncbi:MAG: helix-turn-helix domain-containing protein, partial [Solirubrobacterales bacterium]